MPSRDETALNGGLPAAPVMGKKVLQGHISFAGHVLVLSIIGVLLKQLRLFGESLGLFEITGLVASIHLIASNRAVMSPADVYVTRFMLLMLGAFLAGATVSAMFFEEHLSLRELVAAVYITIIVLGWVNLKDGSLQDRVRLLRDYLAIYCFITVVLAVAAYPLSTRLWYFDVYFGRLMGLSDNPNQLAGLASAGLAVSATLVMLQRTLTRWDLAAISSILVAGTLSLSATFILSATLPALVAISLHVWSVTDRGSWQRIVYNFILTVLALMAVSTLVIIGDKVFGGIGELWSGGSAKGATRFSYWIEALGESLSSPLVGFGPGGHVRVDNSPLLQEAHNIFIELFLSGGLLALCLYLFMIITIAVTALRLREPLIVLALLTMIIMGSFHTVLRHAHYWITFHIILSALGASLPRESGPQGLRTAS